MASASAAASGKAKQAPAAPGALGDLLGAWDSSAADYVDLSTRLQLQAQLVLQASAHRAEDPASRHTKALHSGLAILGSTSIPTEDQFSTGQRFA